MFDNKKYTKMKDYQEIIKDTFERMKRNQAISPLLLMTDQITDEKLQQHAKYVSLEPGEKPLFMADVKMVMWGRVTGLLVTDRNVYYRCMAIKRFFRSFAMLLSARNQGKVALTDLHEISLGNWVMGSGTDTSYLGHRLSINDNVVGTLVLGRYMSFDKKLVENLETLFKVLV